MISKETLLDYIDHNTVPRGPLTVHIDITNRCNLDCVTCWNYSPYAKENKSQQWKKQELPLAVFKDIICDLHTTGVQKLIIAGGGEPFMHADIYEMITAAKQAGFDLTVITNATLIDVQRLLTNPYRPNKLLVNLGAASAASYTKFYSNRSAENFEELVATLQKINQSIALNFVMVISNVNHHELCEMARFAGRFRKARLSVKLASLTPGTARFALSPDQEKKLLEHDIPCCREICRDLQVPHNLDVFSRQLRCGALENPIETTGCYAGLFYSRIFTNGEVFFCCAHIPVGNIFAQPFSSIWMSPQYQQVRQRMQRKEFFPGCKTCGKFNMNLEAHQLLESPGHPAANGEPQHLPK